MNIIKYRSNQWSRYVLIFVLLQIFLPSHRDVGGAKNGVRLAKNFRLKLRRGRRKAKGRKGKPDRGQERDIFVGKKIDDE